MDRLSVRMENNVPASVVEPFAPVDIFPVEEESLIQQTHLFDSLVTHNPEATRDDIDASHVIMGPVPHIRFREQRRIGKQAVQAKHLAKIVPDRGKVATPRLKCTVGVENLRTGQAHSRVIVHERDQFVEATFQHDDVRVDQHEVATGSLSYGLIVRFGEPDVFGVPDQSHVRKTLLDGLITAVG